MINKLKRYDVEDLKSNCYVRPYEDIFGEWVKYDEVESQQDSLLEAYEAIVDLAIIQKEVVTYGRYEF